MNKIELQIMEFLLRGDHSVLVTLRNQLKVANVKGRDMTGVGFFTHFEVPISVERLVDRKRFIISDVHADVLGLEHGAGFILFVKDGALDFLESYIYEDKWPDDAKILRLYYMRPKQPGSAAMVETAERELTWAIGKGIA
jgi:hypothetical protein